MPRGVDRVVLGRQDMLLVAKLLDQADEEVLKDFSFTRAERVRAQALYEDLEVICEATFGTDWDTKEAA